MKRVGRLDQVYFSSHWPTVDRLSADCRSIRRPTVGRQSTDISTDSRPTITDCQSTVSKQKIKASFVDTATDHQPTRHPKVYRQSVNRRPTVADCRSTVSRCIDRRSVDTSADSRPTGAKVHLVRKIMRQRGPFFHWQRKPPSKVNNILVGGQAFQQIAAPLIKLNTLFF